MTMGMYSFLPRKSPAGWGGTSTVQASGKAWLPVTYFCWSSSQRKLITPKVSQNSPPGRGA